MEERRNNIKDKLAKQISKHILIEPMITEEEELLQEEEAEVEVDKQDVTPVDKLAICHGIVQTMW